MINIRIIISTLTLLISYQAIATSIVVIDLEKIINTNSQYKTVIQEMENIQINHLNELEIRERELGNFLNEINKSKLILNDEEINKMILDYNQKLNNFTITVDDYNNHFQEQILSIRKVILDEILILLENYAIEKNVDLILDSNNYLISSNSINITDEIEKKLDNIKFNLEFKDFEKY